jgi:flagellar FliL protein
MSKAPESTDLADDAAPRKGKKKLLILIAAAVLLVGGAAAFFLLRGGDKKAEAAKTEKAVVRQPSLYVPLEPPFVVNFNAGTTRFLQVTVQLMTREPEMVEFLKAHDPAIRNDLLLLLGNQQAEELSTREGKEHLRESALQAVRKIIGDEGGKPEKLEALYFTSFVMQ